MRPRSRADEDVLAWRQVAHACFDYGGRPVPVEVEGRVIDFQGYPNRDSMPYTEPYGIDPRVGIAIDVGFTADFPGAEKKVIGDDLEAKIKAYLKAGDRETAGRFALELQKAKQQLRELLGE